jgi:iron complex transport system substrate-binding protein
MARASSRNSLNAISLIVFSRFATAFVAPPHALQAHGAAGVVTNVTRGCVERFDATVDYFPDKASIEDAVGFSVAYHPSFKVVTVKGAYVGGPTESYVLLQCGAPAPPLTGVLSGAQIVTVPITSLFASSATHLPALAAMDRLDVLTGVSQFDAMTSPEVEARIHAGQVIQFAPNQQLNVERIVTARPSVLMNGASSSPSTSAVRNAGVPVVANAEWLESTALGRAEWMKYIALFLNEEHKAQTMFGAVKARYHALSQRATALPAGDRPLVMTGRATNGTFYIAGGRSYVAALIADAGGRYVWTDNTGVGAVPVDLEAQLRRAANADIWINGGGWKNRAAMLDDEPRYAEFKAYRQGQVWVYERRLNAQGGNDYWSRSITHPDIVLADLVKIFHPRLTPEHALEWYMQVPEK